MTSEKVYFRCQPGVKQVAIAGSFPDSEWSPIPMVENSETEWHRELHGLTPGTRYQYKFVVDGDWVLEAGKDVVHDEESNANHEFTAYEVPKVVVLQTEGEEERQKKHSKEYLDKRQADAKPDEIITVSDSKPESHAMVFLWVLLAFPRGLLAMVYQRLHRLLTNTLGR